MFKAVCTGRESDHHVSPCQQVKVQRKQCNPQPCVVNMEAYGGPGRWATVDGVARLCVAVDRSRCCTISDVAMVDDPSIYTAQPQDL